MNLKKCQFQLVAYSRAEGNLALKRAARPGGFLSSETLAAQKNILRTKKTFDALWQPTHFKSLYGEAFLDRKRFALNTDMREQNLAFILNDELQKGGESNVSTATTNAINAAGLKPPRYQ